MADVRIPDLNPITIIDGNAVLVVDNGTSTFKIKASDLASQLDNLVSKRTIQKLRAAGNFTVPANVTSIRARGSKALPLSSVANSGEIFKWGQNSAGQAGDGTIADRSSPIAVIGNFQFETSTMFEPLALKVDGSAWAWGDNTNGQVGDGTILARSSPVAVLGGKLFEKVIGGANTKMGLERNTGFAWAWGTNSAGQLGDNTSLAKSSPAAVVGGHQFVDLFTFGGSVFLGLKADGSALSWGFANGLGLGDGTINNQSSPTAVIGGHKFVKIATNGSSTHYFGLKADGSVWGWGNNNTGRLGDGTTSNRSSPVAVIGGHVFVDVVGFQYGGMGLKADGSAWTWGLNSNGSIGQGVSGAGGNVSSPVAVIGGHVFKKIFATVNNLGGIKADGSVWGWGTNASGTLGDGTATDRSSPVAMIGGHQFETALQTAVGGGVVHMIKRDGSLWAVGQSTYGEIGDGTILARSSPVAVIGGYKFGRIATPRREASINVKAGDIIPYNLFMGYFGPVFFGRDFDEIELEYWVTP